MQLLTTGNTKIKKGESLGYKTYGIHLAPSDLSGFNTCSSASEGCRASCLNTSGLGQCNKVQEARKRKTLFFFHSRGYFMEQLFKEIRSAIKHCEKNGLTSCFRLNLTSDLPWEKIKNPFTGTTVFEEFPDQQFYDYTKHYDRICLAASGVLPDNYSLTFSRSECNDALVQATLKFGGNVAVVFKDKLPKKYNGYKVVDGDKTDLRFLDPKNCVVGLVAKGKAKKDQSGFVIQ